MPQFQLRYGPLSDIDPESLMAADVLGAIELARQRLETAGVSDGFLLRDGMILQTFGTPSRTLEGSEVDMDQLFAAAGIYVFRSNGRFGPKA